jgi:glycosyltransferase involved in cell wall biosynthesis
VAIVGGYEVAAEPDLDYGTLAQRGVGGVLSRRFLLQVLANASAVVVPSQFSRSEVLGLERPQRLETIPRGVDLDRFRPLEKALSVGTVSETASPSRDVKGIGTFLAAAAELRGDDFHVVGAVKDDRVRDQAPPNVQFRGPLHHEEVSQFLGRLRIYCQLSRRESFGLATAEAMAAGCIPVVTNRGALPEVVGDLGFTVPYGDGPGTVEAIRSALAMSSPHDPCRRRIEDLFSLDLRQKRLSALLNSLLVS